MNIKKNKIKIQRTGVYYTSDTSQSAGVSWFCCHGYGQKADFMIQKFNRRIEAGDYVTCVEAPNRFYWEGPGGRPVATWMTSRYRLNEIEDNNEFLSKVYNDQNVDGKRILFGFSQGGTTVWRWLHEKRPDFDVFVNYAGWIPEDIDLNVLIDYLKKKLLIFVYGKEDQYLNDDRMNKMKEVIRKNNLKIEILEVEGDHRISRDVIDQIIRRVG